ncbi:MAG: hypothetical protein ACTS10_19590 [Kiloniellales bacterium]
MFLLALGLLLTVAWLWAGWYYVSVYFGQENIFYLLPAELGLFLIGFLAPLGIFWLLVSQSFTRRRLARLERQVGELIAQPAPMRQEPSFDVEPTTEPAEVEGALVEKVGAETAGAEQSSRAESTAPDTAEGESPPPPPAASKPPSAS